MTTCGESDEFVTLTASLRGCEPIRRRVRKDVIRYESPFLKEYIEGGATEIKIPLSRPENLDSILKYFHEEPLTVSEDSHLESLWNDARILGLGNLEQFCIDRLSATISSESWYQRLVFSQAQDCVVLESDVFTFINANFDECYMSLKLTSLNRDQMVLVLQLPTVTSTVSEFNRVALILDWIKGDVDDRRPQAHHLLDKVDLTKLSVDSLCSFLDEESAFRNWRCVSLFDSAIRLKKVRETDDHADTVASRSDQSDMFETKQILFGSLENPPLIKQEVFSEESADSEYLQVRTPPEEAIPTQSAQECTSGMQQEFCPPASSSASSVLEAKETKDNAEDEPSQPKVPRLEDSQADPVPLDQPRVSNQKQILYLRKRGQYSYHLKFVTLDGHSISQAQEVQMTLPSYAHHVPKLIWSEEARGLFLLGEVSKGGNVLATVRYMHGERPLESTEGPSMSVTRHRFQPAILNGRLYAIGGSKSVGFKNKTRSSEAEALDITAARSEWQWQSMDCTPVKCGHFTAAVAEGRIYIIGGLRDTEEPGKKSKPVVTNEVICYEPIRNKWDFVSSMSVARCGHASAVVGRKIYVLGGRNSNYTNPQEDLANLRTAEVYTIEENQWASIGQMLRPRYGASTVEMDGKIYIFGGDYHGNGAIRQTVECYDPVSNSWTFVSESLENGGCFDSVAVIDNPEYFL